MFFEGLVYQRSLCQVRKLNLTYAYTRPFPLDKRNGVKPFPTINKKETP